MGYGDDGEWGCNFRIGPADSAKFEDAVGERVPMHLNPEAI
jgi:hypothetical protein